MKCLVILPMLLPFRLKLWKRILFTSFAHARLKFSVFGYQFSVHGSGLGILPHNRKLKTENRKLKTLICAKPSNCNSEQQKDP
jgi:hypothetical protein